MIVRICEDGVLLALGTRSCAVTGCVGTAKLSKKLTAAKTMGWQCDVKVMPRVNRGVIWHEVKLLAFERVREFEFLIGSVVARDIEYRP